MSAPAPSRPRALHPDLGLLPGDLGERLRRLEGQLRDLALGEGAPPGLDLDRFLEPGQPRVRPLLVLLSAAAVSAPRVAGEGYPSDVATEHVAVAVELLHGAVALHDAALGRVEGRRRRAARRLIGGAMGLLGANHLTLRALELARLTPAPEIVGDLVEAMRESAASHALAHQIDGRLPTEAEGLSLAEGHSGALFAFACRAGARVGGAARPEITALGRYGRHTGLGWALAEDLASLDGEPDELVRGIEDRVALHRPPLPVVIANQRDPDVAIVWRRLQRRVDAAGVAELGERVNRVGGVSEGRRKLVLETWSARQALRNIPESAPREALDRLASSLVS